jgi:putative transposase
MVMALYQGWALALPKRFNIRIWALAPVMARPVRNSSPDKILSSKQVFFTTTKTTMGLCLLQSERNANLLIDVMRCYVAMRKFWLHDFVVMPDHLHVLIEVKKSMTIERAMQLIKGRFSFRLQDEFGYLSEVWQPGFSEERVNDEESFRRVKEYIAQNPVKAGLVDAADQYPYCYSYLAAKKSAGAEAHTFKRRLFGRAKAQP